MIKGFLKKLIYRIRGEYTIEQLKSMGLRVGKNFDPQLGFELDPSHCWLIDIGDDVTFGPHVQILAHDASTCYLLGYAKIGRVSIGSGVFIGGGSIVLPNVQIGNNSIIGAGSVVTKSVPEGTVYVGNPARFLCTVEDYIAKNQDLMKSRPIYGEEYTLRGNITAEHKERQRLDLTSGIGYVK